MSKFNCDCGTQLSDVGCPCYHQGFIITDAFSMDEVDDLLEGFQDEEQEVFFCYILDNARR
ncbi:hypothetical protein LCGC14_2966350, partial [marine sediment metagenome]